jgi:PPOX class probable F420-dependent enzyme
MLVAVRIAADHARELFAAARVARLASITPEGGPHLVPIVFAAAENTVVTAVDAKPKRTTALARLANIAARPQVSVLADHYDEDWSMLWWVRADGTAQMMDDPTGTADGVRLLAAKYPQYRDQPPPGPVVVIAVERWLGWSAER